MLIGTSSGVHYVVHSYSPYEVVAKLEGMEPNARSEALADIASAGHRGLENVGQDPNVPFPPHAGISGEETSWSPDGRYVLSGEHCRIIHTSSTLTLLFLKDRRKVASISGTCCRPQIRRKRKRGSSNSNSSKERAEIQLHCSLWLPWLAIARHRAGLSASIIAMVNSSRPAFTSLRCGFQVKRKGANLRLHPRRRYGGSITALCSVRRDGREAEFQSTIPRLLQDRIR